DVLLPAAAWGEKSGTVTSSERRISRQRPFLAPAGESRPDWRIVCGVARRMGFASGFEYRSAAEIFREHARLSAFENDGSRAFDIGALADLSDDEYDALEPVQWPLPAAPGEARHAPDAARPKRLFGDGRFFTRSGKARLVARAEDFAERRRTDRPQHRPDARSVAHDDEDRPLAAAHGPPRGAVRRRASGRRRALRARRRRARG